MRHLLSAYHHLFRILYRNSACESIISLSGRSFLRDELQMLYGRYSASMHEEEEEAAICTVARRQRYFAAIVNTFERDIIRPRGYIKISASLTSMILT